MKRELLYLGHPGLRKLCERVGPITKEVRDLAQDLIDSMLAYHGIGLAAPQIGRYLRLFVIQCAPFEENEEESTPPLSSVPEIFINPVITFFSRVKRVMQEGCLSIPGIQADVIRPHMITVEAMNLRGEFFVEEEVKGWRARVIMHENDHLNGVLYIDHLSKKQRKRLLIESDK